MDEFLDSCLLTCHGEDADEDANVPPGQHHLLRAGPALPPPRRPQPDAKDDEIEQDDGHQPRHVDASALWPARNEKEREKNELYADTKRRSIHTWTQGRTSNV